MGNQNRNNRPKDLASELREVGRERGMHEVRLDSLEELGDLEKARRRRKRGELRQEKILLATLDVPHSSRRSMVEDCRSTAIRWVEERLNTKLPAKVSRRRFFEHHVAAAGCEMVRVRNNRGDSWAARVRFSSCTNQVSVTEIVVANPRGRVAMVSVATWRPSSIDPWPIASLPTELLYGMVSRAPLLQGGQHVMTRSITVDSADAFDRFLDQLIDPAREIPMVVLSELRNPENPDLLQSQANSLAQAATALALVAVLPFEYTFLLSSRVKKNLSVFAGGWRVYKPGFRPGADQRDHPLFLAKHMADAAGLKDTKTRILRVLAEESVKRGRGSTDSITYATLHEEAHKARPLSRLPRLFRLLLTRADTVPKPSGVAASPVTERNGSDSTARVLTKRRRAGTSDDAPTVRRKLRQVRETLRTQRDKYKRAARRTETVVRQRDKMSQRVRQLEGLVLALGGDPGGRVPFPATWNEVPAWCEEKLAGRIVLTGAAKRGIRDAAFEDVGLAARCLLWLATEYRDTRLKGGNGHLHGPIQGRPDGGVSNAPCGADSFNFLWGSRRHQVGWHIKNGGNSRDPRRCLRIYYFWDFSSEQVVVVSLPVHRRTGDT